MRQLALITTRSILVTTVLAGSLSLAGVALADRSRGHDDPNDDRDRRAALLEVPTCWGTRITTPADPPSPEGGMVQVVNVRIEPTSLLRLDSNGRITAAQTNTGCSPRATDHIYIVQQSGNLVANRKIDVTKVEWTGDFTKSGFVEQHND